MHTFGHIVSLWLKQIAVLLTHSTASWKCKMLAGIHLNQIYLFMVNIFCSAVQHIVTSCLILKTQAALSSAILCWSVKLLFWHHVSLSGATADTDRSLNHYMDSSHAMPTRISSPSSRNPCEPTDWCVWHPKWTETARGGKTSHSEGLLVHHSVLWEVPGCCLFP